MPVRRRKPELFVHSEKGGAVRVKPRKKLAFLGVESTMKADEFDGLHCLRQTERLSAFGEWKH